METVDPRAMTHISAILPQVRDSENSKRSSRVSKVETTIEECICVVCGNAFQGDVTKYKDLPLQRQQWEVRARNCPKCKAASEEGARRGYQAYLEEQRKDLREQWHRQCGMSPQLLSRTFDNFEQQYQKAAFQAALDWAKGFDLDSPQGYPSLMLYSAIPGVGKGHLMAAIVNYILDNWKGEPQRSSCPVRFESGPSLVRRIRATYNLRKDDISHEREDEVYRSLAGVPLLLLDDVGKERPSDFTRETYWYLINERVTTGLPVIISSRLEIEGPHSLETLMHEDTVSRLYGMTKGSFIKMKGQDYRKLKGIV